MTVPNGLVQVAAILTAYVAIGSVQAEDGPDLRERLNDLNVKHQTHHYSLAGSIAKHRFKEYGRALEFIYAEYAHGFASLLADKKNARKGRTSAGSEAGVRRPKAQVGDKASNRFVVIVFRTEHEFRAFEQKFFGKPSGARGKYFPSQKLLLILDQKEAKDTYGTLFHEAFHQFLHQYIADPPAWLDEGLAECYASAVPTRHGLRFTRPLKGWWKLCRQILRKGKAIPLAGVVDADRRSFSDRTPVDRKQGVSRTRAQLMNAEAYTLVHMLLADREGRKRLQAYMRELADDDGRGTASITEKYFDKRTCDRLSETWARYVQSRPDQTHRGGRDH